MFCVGSGLRSLPFAALHDGENFLVQNYAVATIPAFNLTDTTYADIRDRRVLAMGASEFSQQTPLPAVEAELSAITPQLWQGVSLLNEEFTLANLQEQRKKETYKLLKQRTIELRRALRQEQLFNAIAKAIRSSLDYELMLQTIVETIGEHFACTAVMLVPVKDNRLAKEYFCYGGNCLFERQQELIARVAATGKTGWDDGDDWLQLAVPLICQQELLAVLSLYQYANVGAHGSANWQGSTPLRWQDGEIQLLEGVAEQAALAVFQAKLYQQLQQQAQKTRTELELARQIQGNLLRQSWSEVEGVKIKASCWPAQEVGGDFFEVYIHPQGDVWLAVGDVSGKGVPAALYMASALSLLRRELATVHSPEPDGVMANLNEAMAEDLFGTNCFITLVLARYTPSSKELVYANAGHIYPLVWSHSTLVQQGIDSIQPNYLNVRGVPLGILPVWQAKAGRMTLKSGDMLLAITDGIPFAKVMGNNQKMLHQEGLWQLITQESYPFCLDNFLTRFPTLTDGVQEDDRTIISLEIL